MYHVCVDPEYRMRGIGKSMVVFAMNALKKENISKVSLIAFTKMMWEINSGAVSDGQSVKI